MYRRHIHWTLPVVVLVVLLSGGCQPAQRKGKQAEVAAADYAHLPRLQETHHRPLREELARIESEGGTPAALDRRKLRQLDASLGRPLGDAPLRDPGNLAALLAGLFPAPSLDRLKRKTALLMGQDELPREGPQLAAAIEVRRLYERQRRQLGDALDRPGSYLFVPQSEGLLADLSCLDVACIMARLEVFLAAEQIAAGRPQDALDPLAYGLRLAKLLADEHHLTLRLAGARLRHDVLQVMAALTPHEGLDLVTARQLLQLLRTQLADWPEDRGAWTGERAQGLHAYELIRDGYLLSVLQEDELSHYREQMSLVELSDRVALGIDADQRLYLQIMRDMINVCDQPYYQRQRQLARLRGQLERLRNTPEYPLIAGDVLLADFEQGHRWQARDRALCQAWVVLLATALDESAEDYRTSPLNGEPFQLQQQPDQLLLWGAHDDPEHPPLTVRKLSPEVPRTTRGTRYLYR